MIIQENTIIHGDSLTVLRQMEPESVDAIITDPPYGINYVSQTGASIKNDKSPFIWFLYDAFRVLKSGEAGRGGLICFTRWDVEQTFIDAMKIAGFNVKSEVIWDKVYHGMGDTKAAFAPSHENIVFAVKGKYSFPGSRPKDLVTFPKINSSKMVHPTEKPVGLLARRLKPIHSIPYSVAQPLERGSNNYYSIIQGKVYNTAANYKRVLQYDPLLKGAIRKNLLTERIDIVKSLGWYRDSPTLTDVDVKYLLLYFEENYGLTVEKKIIDAVAVIANENRYHPVCDFLNALQWDGTERIRFCLHRFLGSDTDDYTYEALKLFLLGAISRAFKPGCKFEVMLCLVGGQGAGKSSFFRLLAVNDDWFSDDLKKLDDENVYRKMQGHWIIEMSEMIATANAKSIEEIKSFLSRQKETYKIPYETHPADRKRQCVFGGSSNTLDFLPLDRTGNRRFVPVMVYPERAEVHILADEQTSREYINQMWAEAMEIYRSGNFRLRFSPAMNAYLKAHQKDFMPEDTKAGQILDYLERYSGSIVCSKQLYKEALGHDYDEPKQWELREINDIMNNAVTGWRAFSNPRYFPEPYRRQKGWERIRNDNEPDNSMDGFQEIPTEEMEQLGLPEEWLKQK